MSTSTDAAAIGGIAATNIRQCYQCGKCSAGCPVAEHMDLLPHQLMRMVQMERVDRALRSEAIWKCVSCMTCSTRCPKSVDCAGVIDALRQASVDQGVTSPARMRTVAFQRAFLDNIRRNGRLCEIELTGVYKARAFFKDGSVPLLLKDAMLAPQLLTRRKFHLLGEHVRDRGVVRRIFEKCEAAGPSDAPSPTT